MSFLCLTYLYIALLYKDKKGSCTNFTSTFISLKMKALHKSVSKRNVPNWTKLSHFKISFMTFQILSIEQIDTLSFGE